MGKLTSLCTLLTMSDAIVHILPEVAGTSASFASSAAIVRFGNNTSYYDSPVFFTLAGVSWYFMTSSPRDQVRPSGVL